MKWAVIGFFILLALAAIMCSSTMNTYKPSVDTAVNRTYDNVDRVVDSHLAPDPLADTMVVHDTITNRKSNVVWIVAFLVVTAVLCVIGYLAYLHLNAGYKKESTKLLREQKRDGKKSLPATTNGVPWVTDVSRSQLPPPPGEVRYLPRLGDNNDDDNDHVSWTT